MTPEEQLARVRAYYSKQHASAWDGALWPLVAVGVLIVAAFLLGMLAGWLLGSTV